MKTEPPTILLLKPKEAAHALGIGRSKMYRLIADGELPSVRFGGCIRVPSDALLKWIRTHTVGGKGGAQ